MTRPSDRSRDMISGTRLDAAIEQALHGATVSDDVAPFAGFVDDLRVMADRPAPQPSAELAVLLASHNAPEPETCVKVSTLQPRRPHRPHARAARLSSRRPRAVAVAGRVAALGFAGKAAIVAAFATTAVAGAAATGILPEPAIDFLRRAIEVVTPFELPATGQDAPYEDATKAAAAANPGDVNPSATDPQPAPTVHDSGVTGTPMLDREPTAVATLPSGSSSAAAIESTIAQIPEAAASPAPQPIDEPSSGWALDHEPPTGPAPKNGHTASGHAPAGAPHPGDGSPGDAPPADPDSAPDLLSAPKGDPPKPAAPEGPRSAPDRHRPHHGRPGGSGAAQDPHDQPPSSVPGKRGPGAAQDPHDQPPTNVPDRPQRRARSPDGERSRSPQAPTGQDPAAPADDRGGASHREDPRASGDEAAHHADGRPERDTGSARATRAPR